MFPFAGAVATCGGEIHGNQSGFGKRNAEQAALSGEQFLNNLVEIWARRIDHVAQAVKARSNAPDARQQFGDQGIVTRRHGGRGDGGKPIGCFLYLFASPK
jgi:hypothetical protein